MNKRHSQFKVRVKFEPNRFSSDYLINVYEQVQPVDSRIISSERKEHEEVKINTAIEGGER
jgi:hypothetical protein